MNVEIIKKEKQHIILTLFLNSIKNWENNPKNKDKINPPKSVQCIMCNDRAINNFFELHTENIDIEYKNSLVKYQVKTKYEGRRTYKVWLELA